MEDGPARRTRASKKIETDKEGEISAILFKSVSNSGSESDSFKTPSNSPTKQKRKTKGSRTPSGQLMSNSVKDIRDFFSQTQSCASPRPVGSFNINGSHYQLNSQEASVNARSRPYLEHLNTTCEPNQLEPFNSDAGTHVFDVDQASTLRASEVNCDPISVSRAKSDLTRSKAVTTGPVTQKDHIDKLQFGCIYFDNMESIKEERKREDRYIKEQNDRVAKLQKELHKKIERETLQESGREPVISQRIPAPIWM